ncbi:unnamed protein product [Amoebophrya sp. A120]|nr:unnamed protein product [Amoebophrya sp. A120]|eukprot:GSA120T00001907001.1
MINAAARREQLQALADSERKAVAAARAKLDDVDVEAEDLDRTILQAAHAEKRRMVRVFGDTEPRTPVVDQALDTRCIFFLSLYHGKRLATRHPLDDFWTVALKNDVARICMPQAGGPMFQHLARPAHEASEPGQTLLSARTTCRNRCQKHSIRLQSGSCCCPSCCSAVF